MVRNCISYVFENKMLEAKKVRGARQELLVKGRALRSLPLPHDGPGRPLRASVQSSAEQLSCPVGTCSRSPVPPCSVPGPLAHPSIAPGSPSAPQGLSHRGVQAGVLPPALLSREPPRAVLPLGMLCFAPTSHQLHVDNVVSARTART